LIIFAYTLRMERVEKGVWEEITVSELHEGEVRSGDQSVNLDVRSVERPAHTWDRKGKPRLAWLGRVTVCGW
jgi:hypothetical protein